MYTYVHIKNVPVATAITIMYFCSYLKDFSAIVGNIQNKSFGS